MSNNKKRILLLATLPPPTHGAAIMNLHVVKSEAINQAFNCKVLPLKFADSVEDIGSISLKKIWRMLLFCFRLLWNLLGFRPSAVYFTISITGGAFFRDALFALIIKLFPVKIIYHLHGKGLAEDCRRSAFKKKLLRFIFKKEYIIILGNSLRSDISGIYEGEPFILPNGIAVESQEPEPTTDLPVFLYLSNLIISKGITIFLESLNELHQKGIHFKAIVAGASFDLKVDEAKKYVIDHHLEQKVTVTGPLYGEDKQKAIASANILVLPSWYKNEAAPVTILEAMQAKLAVISTDNGAIAEIVDDGITGFVVAQKDSRAITDKMELLAANKSKRKEMGELGRKKFLENYTLSIFEKRLLTIFQRILN